MYLGIEKSFWQKQQNTSHNSSITQYLIQVVPSLLYWVSYKKNKHSIQFIIQLQCVPTLIMQHVPLLHHLNHITCLLSRENPFAMHFSQPTILVSSSAANFFRENPHLLYYTTTNYLSTYCCTSLLSTLLVYQYLTEIGNFFSR